MAMPGGLPFAVDAAPLSPLVVPVVYRSVSLTVVANLGVHPLDGNHSGQIGGRYNRPGAPPTCYFAGTQTLATFECEQEALVMRIPGSPLDPRIAFAVTVAGARVLDLTQMIVLAGLGVAHADLVRPTAHWQHMNRRGLFDVTQQIGDAARIRPDVDGLLVPSWLASLLPPNLLPRTTNLVLFMDPRDPRKPRRAGVTLEIHDPTRLLP
jgi:RES domain-containing protein